MEQNLSLLLSRYAKKHRLSVIEIAAYTGATRTTIYNWLSGSSISPAYRPPVQKLIAKLARKTK